MKPSLFPPVVPPSSVEGLGAGCVMFYYPSHVEDGSEPCDGRVEKEEEKDGEYGEERVG